MAYELFLFDLDDTLLDFKESERLSFFLTLQELGLNTGQAQLYEQYQMENTVLWKLFEQGKTTKDHLKVERFRRLFAANRIDLNPELASTRYLQKLPETVVLIDHALEICQWLAQRGEIGIVTNGIQAVQNQRIRNSPLAPYISFICVSEECGLAKPDVRFFEYSAKMASAFQSASTLVIGDRLETDIQGAQNFGLDSCWFNPQKIERSSDPQPTYEIHHLSEIRRLLQA